MNTELFQEIITQDYKSIYGKIKKFLETEAVGRKSKGFVFGLSGGIDSAIIASLCPKSLRKKSLAIIMPDSKVTSKKDNQDAIRLADSYEIPYKLLDISSIQLEYSKYLQPQKLAVGNLRARIRSNILYYFANSKNLLVLGSSDKSEYLIGYFTKFGDGAADLLPIVSLYKTQIRQLAKFLDIPESITSKKSSPNLWHGQYAEKEIGMSYDQIDMILYSIVDKKLSLKESAKITGFELLFVDKIYKLYKNSEHKRSTAVPCKL